MGMSLNEWVEGDNVQLYGTLSVLEDTDDAAMVVVKLRNDFKVKVIMLVHSYLYLRLNVCK
jgi:hypothetical protein